MNHKFKTKSSVTSLKNSKEAYINDDDNNDNDDEELEALRLAALQSLQYKKTLVKDLSISNCKSLYGCTTSTNSDCNTVLSKKFDLQNNKNSFCQFQQKSDLIEIVPKDTDTIVVDIKSKVKSNSPDPLHYFHCKDLKEKIQKNVISKTCSVTNSKTVAKQIKEIKTENTEHDRKIGKNIYDDDIILMSDHEEEDSLERLMDEMEKEINNTQLSVEKCTNKCSSNVKTRNENMYSSAKGQNMNTRCVKKIASYTKYRSLSPQTTLHITSLEKSKKLKTKPQYHMSKIKSTSVFCQPKLSSKLEKSIRTPKPDTETTSKFNNIEDLRSIRTRAGLKSLLHKNETSFIKQSYLTENSFSGLKSKSRNCSSSNHILSHNISSVKCLEQLNSKHSEKMSISLNTINTPVCCHNYSRLCCKRSKCILKERLPKKERHAIKSSRLVNTSISEAKHRKFESVKTLDFIENNKKMQINSDIEQFSSNSLRKSNLTIIDSKLKEHNVDKIFNPDIHFLNVTDEINNHQVTLNYLKNDRIDHLLEIQERKISKKKRKRKESDFFKIMKIKNDMCKRKCHSILEFKDDICNSNSLSIDDRGDLRTELSRRRAERLNKLLPIQSTRLLQSAFQEVVNESAEKSLRTNRKCFFKDYKDSFDHRNTCANILYYRGSRITIEAELSD